MILSRTLLFITWAINVFIGGVVLLMVLRLIADAMDLNPFAWMSRTIRRLTDGLVMPVRGGLRNLSMDPKFAPLVVILLVILLGFFVRQLVSTIFFTIAGVSQNLPRGYVFVVLGFLLNGFLSIYSLLILMRIIFSWGQVSYGNRVMRFLYNATEPLLGPLRRMIPPLGWIDLSPLVAFIIIWLFQAAIAGTLMAGSAMPVL
jgi:YggT family protein